MMDGVNGGKTSHLTVTKIESWYLNWKWFFFQLTVADINKDSTLEIIAIDTSGNVVCLNEDGTLAWEVEISGDSSPGSRLVDVNNDGYLDVIIPTNEGYAQTYMFLLILLLHFYACFTCLDPD
jgi:hypothetical protein